MDKDDVKGICIIVGFIIFISIIVAVVTIFANGGPTTANTYEVCSEDNMDVFSPLGIQTNACVVKTCDNEYDGITFCDQRVFIVCGNDFCAR